MLRIGDRRPGRQPARPTAGRPSSVRAGRRPGPVAGVLVVDGPGGQLNLAHRRPPRCGAESAVAGPACSARADPAGSGAGRIAPPRPPLVAAREWLVVPCPTMIVLVAVGRRKSRSPLKPSSRLPGRDLDARVQVHPAPEARQPDAVLGHDQLHYRPWRGCLGPGQRRARQRGRRHCRSEAGSGGAPQPSSWPVHDVFSRVRGKQSPVRVTRNKETRGRRRRSRARCGTRQEW